MKYIQVSFATTDIALREILTAVLAEQGFESFDEDSAHLHAYIQQQEFSSVLLPELEEHYGISGQTTEIEQRNWNEEWEKGFNPVTVDGFCTIRATFHDADTSVLHDIIITPKMSFGTGHHATTQLMMQQMRDCDFNGKRVFDFGTGTGVLAILAEKLGAKHIVAIDNDEWSYVNTIENISHNHSMNIEVFQGSIEKAGDDKYDVILANINRHILLQYMNHMQTLLAPGGLIFMSGILDEDEQLIVSEAIKSGFTFVSKMQQEKWICLSFS